MNLSAVRNNTQQNNESLLPIPSPFLRIYDKSLAFEVNLFLELKISRADHSIIFN